MGLALSGGGFRAAAFHLGVLRGLDELGLLARVEVVSGVSGGALLAAAWVASSERSLDDFAARMRRFLARDLKARVVLAALRPDRCLRLLVDPSYSLTEVLAVVLDRELFDGCRLGALGDRRPRLVLNATCVNHGTGWRFSPDRLGDWVLATRDRETLAAFPLARAVAASAAFPGGFAPLVLPGRLFAASRRPPREVLLTDGGVDDNLGVQALLAEECTRLIVSDGSFPFQADPHPLRRFGLTSARRVVAGLMLAGLATWGAARLDVPAVLLALLLGLSLLAALRLRFALWLFGAVMMRGQRRGLLRRLFAGSHERSNVYVGLGSALASESERRLRALGLDLERLRRARTDLALDAAQVDGLVELGRALIHQRLGATGPGSTIGDRVGGR